MIFYLSCTGNTRWVAETLADRLGDRAVNIADAFEDDCRWRLSEGETLGFCFPIHGWRPPKFFLEFFYRLRIENYAEMHPYTYAVCTAGDTVGLAMELFEDICDEKGYPLDFYYDVIMPNTYVGLPFMDVDSPELAEKKLKKAVEQVEEVLGHVTRRFQGNCVLKVGKWPKTNTEFLGKLFVKHLLTDRWFKADKRLCSKCGKCVKACPTGNIRPGDDGTPEWERCKKCMACFACYHVCPKHAIRYGWMTRGKGQYFFGVRS